MAQTLWASRGAEMLDKIGPAVIVTHSAGGPFGWLVADQRPALVKAVVCVEGAGAPFAGAEPMGAHDRAAGARSSGLGPCADHDPRRDSPCGLSNAAVQAADRSGAEAEEPAGDSDRHRDGRGLGRAAAPPVEFLKQAGCAVEDLQLKDQGILGNGHFMMLETQSTAGLRRDTRLDRGQARDVVQDFSPPRADDDARMAPDSHDMSDLDRPVTHRELGAELQEFRQSANQSG